MEERRTNVELYDFFWRKNITSEYLSTTIETSLSSSRRSFHFATSCSIASSIEISPIPIQRKTTKNVFQRIQHITWKLHGKDLTYVLHAKNGEFLALFFESVNVKIERENR